MHPIHLKVFWWRKPRLTPEQRRDVARLVRFLGIGRYVIWLRTPENQLRSWNELLCNPPDPAGTVVHSTGAGELFWRGIYPIEKWMTLGWLAFLGGATVYVGSLEFLAYVGGAIAIYHGLYFGSFFLAQRRFHRWLWSMVQDNTLVEPEPTKAECDQLFAKWNSLVTDDLKPVSEGGR